MAQFFINRPVFAWVVSILIMVLGGLAITKLPVAQYPNVAPPSISVTANYAGASAETMQETVTSVIEQQLNGIDNLLYMSSVSDASGLATVTLYFLPGTNPDTAQVQVQNKVQLATPSLPQTVQQQGVVVAKATRNFMMFFTLSTTDDSLDEVALGNYIASSVLDPIRRVTGVGFAHQHHAFGFEGCSGRKLVRNLDRHRLNSRCRGRRRLGRSPNKKPGEPMCQRRVSNTPAF